MATWRDDFGIESDKFTASEVVEIALERIRTDRTNCLISVAEEQARSVAASLDAAVRGGLVRPPLFGMPIVVKDNIDVAGVRCTIGSQFFQDRQPEHDAFVVERLRAAGAVVVGKASLHEFAYGGTNQNPFYGAVHNPWDYSRIPGGSSGGSAAAVAAGLCGGALGTDTGGSVRCPASLNGLTGLRPTRGALSLSGVFPISFSFDTVGPLAYRATDVRLLFEAMVGVDSSDADSTTFQNPVRKHEGRVERPLAGLRVGVPTDFFFDGVQEVVLERVGAAIESLRGLGAEVVDVRIPSASLANEVATLVIRAEALGIHQERLEGESGKFGSDVRRRLELGREIPGWRVARLYREMHLMARELRTTFDECDVVATPTVPGVASLIEGAEMISETAQLTRFTYPWSVAEVPAISVPVGVAAGLPVGMQLVGAPFSEGLLLDIADALQEVTDCHELRPG